MLIQCKYTTMHSLYQRTIALGFVILLNLVFGLCSYFGAYGMAGMITAVALATGALLALLVVCIAADLELVKQLFTAPGGYLTFLTPAPRWQVLLGRIVPMVVMDLVSLAIGVAGVVIQSILMAGEVSWSDVRGSGMGQLGWLIPIVVLGYTMLLLTIYFVTAFCKSVLFRAPGKWIIGILTACAILYIFNLANFALMPFTAHHRFNAFFTFELILGFNAATFVYFGLAVLKNAALFLGTTYLMERKINI